MYDLLLKGGTILDPSQSIHQRMDLAITGNEISQLSPSIAETEATRVIDVAGKIVTPGSLIFIPTSSPRCANVTLTTRMWPGSLAE